MKRYQKSLLLVLALVIMAAGVYGVQRFNQKESVTETAGSYPLTTLTKDDLAGLAWQTENAAYHFVRQDGTWQNADDAAFPVNQDTLDGMADDLIALTADRVLENVGDKADYGLAEPAFSLTAEWNDGTSTTYAMGDALPFGDGYYLSLSGEEGKIYAVAASLETTFAKEGVDLAAMETLPAVENATRLTIGSALDVSYRETSSDIDPNQHWYAADGTPMDDGQVSGLLDDAKAIAWQELVYPNADAETLASVALDEASAVPITLYDGEEPVLTLLIGGADSSAYYARLAGSSMVYKVASSALTELLDAQEEGLARAAILPVSYEDLASVSLTAGDHAVAFTGLPVEENGQAAEETGEDEAPEATPEPDPVQEAQEDLWTLIAALSGDACPDDGQDAELLLTIEAANRNGIAKTVSIYAYDADNYLARPSDGASRLLSADAVDKIIRTMRQMN